MVAKNPNLDENERNETDVLKAPGGWYGTRHTQIIMLFVLISIGYGMRVILSVGIVAMTTATNPDFPSYDWSDKSVVLSSFFWGYVIPQIGVGQLAKNYGPKWFLVGSMLISSIFTILIPPMAELGSWGVMICRVIQGFTQGFFYPCTHNILSKWSPLSERSRLAAFVYAGGPFGTVITLPVTGWLSASSIGWPSPFYIYGALGFAWAAVWAWMGANSPKEHKTISAEEKEYIQKSLGETDTVVNYPTPWKHIATSLPLISILVAHCAQNWGYWTLMTEIPLYMDSVLNFNIEENGLVSAAPYLTLWILSFVFSSLTDFLINRNILSVANGRKMSTSIGFVVPAITLVFLGFVDKDQKGLAITLLILSVGFNSAVFCGHQINHIDIAPTHAGTLMGITNGLANIFSIIAPLLVQVVVTDESDPDQWKIVFITASVIYVVCDVFYIIFGKGELQYWDKIDKITNDVKPGDDNPVKNKTDVLK